MSTQTSTIRIDPDLDLVIEREIDVAPELVWEAWTTPEHLKQWFCPRPWTTPEVELDVRPGGIFRTVMQSPEGERFDNTGCYLEVVPGERLVWTSALEAGFRPAGTNADPMAFTAVLLIEPSAVGTKYTAIAMHGTKATRDQHEEMGFYDGWNAVIDQMVERIKAG